MRRLLFLLASATLGAGLLILLSAGTGAGRPFGIAFCALLTVGGAVGARRGRGPVARGVRSPQLAANFGCALGLCVLATLLWWWRPSVGTGMPIGAFLGCSAVSAVLMIVVGLTGRRAETGE
ncbi:hypothetical protein ACWT_4850 [Actinoplanes sp. SE50]|uniref:hypothetical protein n=1 Tax=unclassified Actinoplanes TaxID=2626549 RepID=UPI00023EC4C5|nr:MULTISPECIES: hypothetical protein [unclassified Actinoplanes]AEV85869.1 hypothetical protein ACPL_4980 [Actinoplanes sp. SE50/110]ATO84265.1 hypothetical protein ACWT_4850 [Actinoplanes sp. SE50]SLM01675.1 hypothetical protein ACSP50_4911 [Actinoplanes sp. SE50/110]